MAFAPGALPPPPTPPPSTADEIPGMGVKRKCPKLVPHLAYYIHNDNTTVKINKQIAT